MILRKLYFMIQRMIPNDWKVKHEYTLAYYQANYKKFQAEKWIKNLKNHFLDSEKKMPSGPVKTLPDWPTLYLKKHFKSLWQMKILFLRVFQSSKNKKKIWRNFIFIAIPPFRRSESKT